MEVAARLRSVLERLQGLSDSQRLGVPKGADAGLIARAADQLSEIVDPQLYESYRRPEIRTLLSRIRFLIMDSEEVLLRRAPPASNAGAREAWRIGPAFEPLLDLGFGPEESDEEDEPDEEEEPEDEAYPDDEDDPEEEPPPARSLPTGRASRARPSRLPATPDPTPAPVRDPRTRPAKLAAAAEGPSAPVPDPRAKPSKLPATAEHPRIPLRDPPSMPAKLPATAEHPPIPQRDPPAMPAKLPATVAPTPVGSLPPAPAPNLEASPASPRADELRAAEQRAASAELWAALAEQRAALAERKLSELELRDRSAEADLELKVRTLQAELDAARARARTAEVRAAALEREATANTAQLRESIARAEAASIRADALADSLRLARAESALKARRIAELFVDLERKTRARPPRLTRSPPPTTPESATDGEPAPPEPLSAPSDPPAAPPLPALAPEPSRPPASLDSSLRAQADDGAQGDAQPSPAAEEVSINPDGHGHGHDPRSRPTDRSVDREPSTVTVGRDRDRDAGFDFSTPLEPVSAAPREPTPAGGPASAAPRDPTTPPEMVQDPEPPPAVSWASLLFDDDAKADPGAVAAYRQALEALHGGRVTEAIAALRALIREDPSNPDYAISLALAEGLGREP